MPIAGLLALIAVLLAALPVCYWQGKSRGRSEAAVRSVPGFPAEALDELDAALRMLRQGSSLEALAALNAMRDRLPEAPSLHFAAAVAALQSGYPREAGRLADISIRLGERVADSLALKAACAGADNGRPVPEDLLRAAIAADPMNANPFLELATLLRGRGRNQEARVVLSSAGLRLMPADARSVLDTTLAIMSQAEAGGEGVSPAAGVPERDFPAALAELQAGRFHQAAEILRRCREALPADLYAYLINDPEFRRYAARPELRGLF